jgi:fumarate reductase flavoprotein subunit
MMFVTTNLSPSSKLFEEGAILVNKSGERFVNEREQPQLAIARQPERIAFIVMDDLVASKFGSWPFFVSTAPGVAYAYVPDYRRNRKDIYAGANSIEELANILKIPPATLRSTINKYNADLPKGAMPLAKPPFHALGPAKAWIVLTDGGLKVSERLEVLNKDGHPIPGLFAAGSNGQGGLLLEGHGHHLGWAFTSGRIAGGSVSMQRLHQKNVA